MQNKVIATAFLATLFVLGTMLTATLTLNTFAQNDTKPDVSANGTAGEVFPEVTGNETVVEEEVKPEVTVEEEVGGNDTVIVTAVPEETTEIEVVCPVAEEETPVEVPVEGNVTEVPPEVVIPNATIPEVIPEPEMVVEEPVNVTETPVIVVNETTIPVIENETVVVVPEEVPVITEENTTEEVVEAVENVTEEVTNVTETVEETPVEETTEVIQIELTKTIGDGFLTLFQVAQYIPSVTADEVASLQTASEALGAALDNAVAASSSISESGSSIEQSNVASGGGDVSQSNTVN